jgi:hypothetical protein
VYGITTARYKKTKTVIRANVTDTSARGNVGVSAVANKNDPMDRIRAKVKSGNVIEMM